MGKFCKGSKKKVMSTGLKLYTEIVPNGEPLLDLAY